jgi:hypothetical protein
MRHMVVKDQMWISQYSVHFVVAAEAFCDCLSPSILRFNDAEDG